MRNGIVKMRLIVTIIISLFSLIIRADEIPEILKKDLTTLQWSWTFFGKEASKPVGYLADFTKQDKSSDGTIYLPWAAWDLKGQKWASGTVWSRINCEKNNIESLGVFENGLFSASNPIIFANNTVGAIPKHMICGVTTQDGDKIYGLMATVTETTYALFGWIPDKIKIEDIQGAQVTFKMHQYDIYTGNKGFSYAYVADCANKKIIPKDENYPAIDISDKKNGMWIYAYNSACSLKDKLLSQPINSSKDQKLIEDKVNVSPKTNNERKENSIEKIKTKCTDLGFKPKTEKFGNCVLELMK